MTTLTIRQTPCRFCPYRIDCPPGVWDESEYLKLPDYDNKTFNQPFGVFLCHEGDRQSEVCRGWAEVHGKQPHSHALLSARLAGIDRDIAGLKPSGVPLFTSGQESCDHGMSEIEEPGDKALNAICRLQRKIDSHAKTS